MTVIGTNIFAGIYNGLFLSTNNGTSWTQVDSGLANANVHAFAVIDTNLFAASAGIYLSTNMGTSWTAVDSGVPNTAIYSLAASGKNVFAGIFNAVLYSTNNGTSWNSTFSNYSNNPEGEIWAIIVSDSNLFVGSSEGGIWRRPLSDIITGVKENPKQLPTEYSLSQNYPNPFNPSTTITFSLEAYSHASLRVYDLLGREVTTLINQEKPAGTYDISFDGSKCQGPRQFPTPRASIFPT